MANDHVLPDGRRALLTYPGAGVAGTDANPTVVKPIMGLSATFFASATLDTTGTIVVAANTSRQMGVWMQCGENTNGVMFGDSLATAVVNLRFGNTTPTQMVFIPGTGPIYAKATAVFSRVSGYSL